MIAVLLGCARPVPAPTLTASVLPLPTHPSAQTATLVEDGDGLLLTWQVRGEEANALYLSRFDAAGWSPAVELASSPDLLVNWADYPSVVRGGDDALYAHWLRKVEGGAHAYDIQVLRSEQDGSWASLGALNSDDVPAEHGFVSWVAEPNGARAVWLDGRGMVGGEPMSLRSARVDKGVHDEVIVDGRVCDCCRTDAAGELVVYRDRSETEVRDIRVARATDAGWASAELSADGWQIAGCPVNGPDVELSPAGAVTAWFTAPDSARVRVSFAADGWSFGDVIEVAPAVNEPPPLGRVAVSPDGDEALVLWLAAIDDEVAAIYIRRVSAAGAVGPVRELGRTANSRKAGFPTIARHGGDLVVAWTVPEAGVHAVLLDPRDVPAVDGALELTGPSPQKLSALPTLSLHDLAGEPVAIEGPTLIALWATWCGPCREELAQLQQLHDAGVAVVAVSIDDERDVPAVRALVDELGLSLPIAHQASAAKAFGTETIPASYLFDADGKLVWHRIEAFDASDPDLTQALASIEAAPELP